MVVFSGTHGSSLVQGRPEADLCLRIVGTSRDGQVVRLRAPKCTVGSARGCTLRLQAGGVRPVQCVILRGTHGTVARCWSAGTRLNGQSFSDALLTPGDRLAIGPIDLQVLTPAEADAACSLPVSSTQAMSPDAERESTAADPRRLRDLCERNRKLVGALRGLKAEVAQLKQQGPATAPDMNMAERAAELASATENFERLRSEWDAARAAAELHFDARNSQLAESLRQFETARAGLAEEQQRCEEQKCQWQRERDEAARFAAELEQQRTELIHREEELINGKASQAAEDARLTAAATALEEQRAEFGRAQEQFEASQQSVRNEHREQLAQIEASRQAFEQQRLETQNQHREAIAQLEAARASLQQDRAEFQKHAAEQTALHERQRCEFERRSSELAQEQNALSQREAKLAELETIHQTACDELRQAQAELERETVAGREDLENQRAADQRQREEAAAAQRGQAEALDERAMNLKEQQTLLTQDQAALGKAKGAFETERANLNEQREALEVERERSSMRADESKLLEQQRSELKALRTALETERELLRAEREALAQRRAAANEAQAEVRTRDDQPEDEDRAASSMSNRGARSPEPAEDDEVRPSLADERAPAAQWEDDEQEDEREGESAEAQQEDDEPQPSRQPTKAHGDEEESVEEYMAALLTRMRGGKPAEPTESAAPAVRRAKRKSDPGSEASHVKSEAAAAAAVPVVDLPNKPAEITRRPPVRHTTDLSAMRELANTQARIAIDLHGKKRLLKKALASLAAAVVTLGCTFAVLILVNDDEALRNGAMVGVVAGIYWMLGGATALQQMAAQRAAKTPPREVAEKAEAPKR